MQSDRRRLLEKLIREVSRCEALAADHPVREGRRVGAAAPPVLALREVADHAIAMRARFEAMAAGHELIPIRRGRLSTLKRLVIEHVVDPERSFRIALLDLRHGVEVVQILSELSRDEEMFGLRRWTKDWLLARRTLVARVEAQLAWYALQRSEIILPPEPSEDGESPMTSPTSPGFLDWL
jgi:hypothetical protein